MVDVSRQIIVIVITIGVVLFYQFYDDKKNNVKRENIWSILKMPILMSCLTFLAMNLKNPKPSPNFGGTLADASPENIYTELANW